MCFVFSLFPATFWVTIGYFVLLSAGKAEGRVRTFGRILAGWLFVVSGVILICGAYVSLADLCPIGKLVDLMRQLEG